MNESKTEKYDAILSATLKLISGPLIKCKYRNCFTDDAKECSYFINNVLFLVRVRATYVHVHAYIIIYNDMCTTYYSIIMSYTRIL